MTTQRHMFESSERFWIEAIAVMAVVGSLFGLFIWFVTRPAPDAEELIDETRDKALNSTVITWPGR